MTNYFLMHKDRRLLAFSIEKGSVLNVRVNENEKIHLPVSYGADIMKWLRERSIPATRKGLSERIHDLNTFDLMLSNLGLSLTDSYWLNPVGSGYTWDSVNLYRNDFRDSLSLDLTDNRSDIAGKTNFLPSASLKGDLKKKWLIDESGVRILVKGNYSDSCIQSISEVLATKIYQKQPCKISFTPYSFIKISSDNKIILGCKCPNYTTEDLEFVPAIDIVNSLKCPNDKNYFQYYLMILEEHGLHCRDFYDMEIMVDFVITNTDRHFNNFGILRDSNTLQFVKPAPVFDSGNSMFYNKDYIPVDAGLLDIDVSSFYRKEVRLLSQVKNRGLLKTEYLPKDDEVYNLLEYDSYLPEEKRERIVQAYRRKIRFLEDFQNGADLWSYHYQKNCK